MLIDWAIYGALVAGFAFLLNKTIFAKHGATPVVFLVLTIVMFFVNAIGMTAMKFIRYEAISREVGTQITASNPLDIGGAFVMTMIFYSMLNRREKLHSGG